MKEILSLAAKRLELHDITLSDISHTQRDKYHVFPYINKGENELMMLSCFCGASHAVFCQHLF